MSQAEICTNYMVLDDWRWNGSQLKYASLNLN